jgi:hypothetical protein
MGRSSAPRRDNIQLRKVFDNIWTLAAILAAYLVVNIPLQRRVWAALAATKQPTNELFLGLFAAALVALALATYLTPSATEKAATWLASWVRSKRGLTLVLLVLCAALVPTVIAYGVLDRFQNSGDEYAYFFQAEQFAKGHLWAKAPPLGDSFVPFRTWIIGDKWLSQYPPGWPLVLAMAMVAGIPTWTVNAVLGAGGVASLLSPLWNFKDRSLSFVVVALYLGTTFYLLNAASFYSHMLPALLILLVCLTCLWYQRERKTLALVACGALLGLIGLTRYFSLVLLLPALAYWMFVENRAGRARMIAVVGLAGLPFLAWLMAYQYWITGNPLHNTYSLITTDDVFLSFKPHDILEGAQLTLYRFAELSVWGAPLLVPAYLVCLVSKVARRSLAFYDLIFPCFVVGYVFFADLGGNRYGPRYYFDAFPLMLVTIVSAVPQVTSWVEGTTRRALVTGALAISGVYLLTALPFAVKDYHAQVVTREEPYRLAAAQGLANAIVILETPSGRGLLESDLARNEPDLHAPVLYARPEVPIPELRKSFPDRSIWMYTKAPSQSRLTLAYPATSPAPVQR